MDVRQFAFLARQPSAAVKNRSSFLGMPKRGLALVLANAMFWQPLLAQADGIAVSGPGTTLGQAGNGVPIVNIAAPNGSGLSHNQFKDYNVGANGVILNNSTNRTQSTQLGGIILGNSNFNGRAASTILNEVNGGSPSQLRGYTEVAGQSAHVIVANPYGITCNGCGFINTPQATLTTGKAVIENGQVSRYQVDKGSVAIEGTGLNANNVDQFEIITRATTINAQIQAKKLTIVAGRNDVDARTLNATARAADGSKVPDLAIDSSALGGMYVGAVRLVGTEAGVGVKLSGDMVAGGDIQIDAAGNVVMGQTSAGAAVAVKAASVEAKGAVYAGTDLSVSTQGALTNQQTLAAKDSITLDAGGRLSNSGIIEAGVNADNTRNTQGDVRLKAQSVDNAGKTVIASRDLTINTGELVNQGGTLSAQRDAQLNASILDNQNQGRILSAGSLGVTASQLLNQKGQLLATDATLAVSSLGNDDGQIQGDNALSIKGSTLSNLRGTMAAGKSLDVTSAMFDNTAGKVISDGVLTTVIASQLLNQTGLFASKGDARLTLGTLDNRQGTVVANTNLNLQLNGVLNNQRGTLRGDNRMDLNAGHVDNSVGGRISSGQTLTASVSSLDQHNDGRLFGQGDVSLDLNGGHLNNRGGVINAPGHLLLSNLNDVDNQDGEISSNQAFTLAANTLNNHNAKLLSEQALTVRVARALDNAQGLISSKRLEMRAGSLDNQGGALSAGDGLIVQVDGVADNRNGKVLARTASFSSASLDNRQGLLQGDAALNLDVRGAIDNRQGTLFAGQSFDIAAESLDNSGGKLTSDGRLTARIAGQLLNLTGLFNAVGELSISAASLDNSAKGNLYSQAGVSLDLNRGHLNNQSGLIHAPGTLRLSNLGSIDNQGGEISTAQALAFTADSLDNRGGKLLSEQGLLVRIANALDNTKGLVAATGLDLRSASLINAEGKLSARDDLTAYVTTALDNRQGEILGATTSLTGTSLDNANGLIQGDKRLVLNYTGLINSLNGRVVAGQSMDLSAARLDNTGGQFSSDGSLNALISGQLINQAGLFASAGLLKLTAESLDNQNKGRITGKSELALTIGHLDNRSGLLNAGGGMTLKVDSLDNRGAEVSSINDLVLEGRQLDNSTGGKVLAGGDIHLTADRLDNQLKGSVYAKRNLSMALNGPLLNQQGTLRSDVSLTLDMNHGSLNNASGLINTPGVLVLKNLSTVANQKGEISSDHAFSLVAQTLDNSEGKLLSDQALTLKIDQALVNIKGVIASAGLNAQAALLDNTDGVLSSSKDLNLAVAAEWLNTDGEVSSSGISVIDAMTLNNRNGQVLSDVSLNLTIRGALENHGGTLGAGQRLQVAAASLDNSQSGSLVSDGSLSVQVTGLLDNQANGHVLSKGNMTLSAGGLDNRGGVLNSKQGQTLTGQSLNNQGGLISAVGPLSLKMDTADNTHGRIASQADLDATVGVLNQQGGEFVAQGNLTLTGKGLDNRNGGLVGATKALKLNVDSVDNRVGEISGQLKTEVSGQRLDNSGGKVLAGTSLELVMGEVINQAKGLVFARDVNLNASTLDNTEGSLASQRSLTVQLSEGLNNTRGKISSEDGLQLHAQRVDNTRGSLSSAGKLMLTSDEELLNQGGVVESAQSLMLTTTSLDNSRQGLLKSQGATLLTTGRLNNDLGGRVISASSLDLKAAQLTNGGRIASTGVLNANVAGLTQTSGSELFSNSQLNLDMNQGQLTNAGLINAPLLVLKNLGDVSNRNGEISSQNAFNLAARSLDNNNGKLISNQTLNLYVERVLTNAKGSISASGLSVHSASLDNTDGLVSSREGLEINADGLIDNQRGSLIGDGAVLLTAATLDNRAGEIAGKAKAALHADHLDNRKGQLVSTDTLAITSTKLDNRNGLVGATKALKLDVDDVDNRAGELTSNAELDITGQRLDNSDNGQVFAAKGLNLAVNRVLNRALGQLNGQRLTLTGTELDNSGGTLLSQQPLMVDLTGDLTNNQGLLSSEGSLDVKARSIDNTKGSFSSAQGLNVVVSDALNNQGGELVTDASLMLRSASLGNQQGTVSGKGPVSVTTGTLNNQAGKLNSGNTLTLTAGQLNNGGSIGSAMALNATVTGLDQQAGKLFSQAGLSLDLSNGRLNNQGGLINASGPLLLKNLQVVDNYGGEISSDQTFTLAAQSLDNSSGKLLSHQTLNLRIDQALMNLKGLIGAANLNVGAGAINTQGGTLSSHGDLLLVSRGVLDNQGQGLISAAGVASVESADLNNQNGNILGGTGVVLSTLALNNSAQGLINSQGTLDLTATSLATGNGAEVSAKGAMELKLNGLTLAGGRIVGGEGISLDLNNADLDNRNGLIAAKGPLSLNRIRAINNQNGELSTQQSLALNLDTLDNTGGKVISSQMLSVTAGTMLNQNGLMSGWQGLSVKGDSLDNRNYGTLSSRSGAVDVHLAGTLLNTNAGALVSQGRLDLQAAGLDNRGGILSSGAGQSLTITDLLNNSAGGLIDSGADLDLQAVTLANQTGTINAQKNMAISATDLNNTSGSAASNARLTMDLLGSLTNTNGKIASAGPLVLSRAVQINNQGGQIVSQSVLSLLAGGIDNSQRGTIAGKGHVAIATTGILRNETDGLIYSQDADLLVKAESLVNNRGALQGSSGLNLDIQADIDNQGGKLLAQTGDAIIKAHTLDNQGGTVSSTAGMVYATLSDTLLNGDAQGKGGVVQGQRLKLSAGTIDNQRGRIAAQDGDTVISANHFLNAYGGLYAKEGLQARGIWLDNSFGKISAKRIDLGLTGQLSNHSGIIESDETLRVVVNDLVNDGGKLRALGREGQTLFQVGNQFDNRNGIVETVNTNLSLVANTFQNNGGQLLHTGEGDFDISLPNVTGAGGSIVTRGGLTLNADTWTNSSVIQAGRLNVNVGRFTQTETGQLLASSRLEGKGDHWTNNGVIASDASLALQLTGGYEGNGRVSSVTGLDLTAAQLTLGQPASIAGGGTTRITTGGTLANEGRVTSAADLSISAGVINNRGTLGSTGNLRLVTPALLNQNGLIFSGGDMALRTDTFTNRFADVYGLGNVSIAKDDNGGQSTSINNVSSTIESGGDLSLAAAYIENRKDVFKTTGGLVSSYIGVQCSSCSSTAGSGPSFLVWAENFKSQVVEDSAASSMTAGRNFLVAGGDMVNKASTLTAGSDVSFTLKNFTNEGASVGDYSLRRSYDFGSLNPSNIAKFMLTVMNYNRTHDPLYNARAPAVHTFNSSGVESYKPIGFEGGRDAVRFYTTYGTLRIQTKGEKVDLNAGAADGPWEMLSARPFNSTTTGSSSSINAVVQAGGAVSINAAQNLTNSVVRQNVAVTGNGPRGEATKVTGNTAVMVTINRELPPGLALQQVNPLELPGFSLPSGKNGLFRLSADAANDSQVSRSDPVQRNWTLGEASIGLVERQQAIPDTQGRTLQITGSAPTAASALQLSLAAREAGGLNGTASTVNTGGNVDGGAWQSGRTTGIDITHGGEVKPQIPGTGFDLPGLSSSERDPRIQVTTPIGELPGLNVPGLSVTHRDTAVTVNTGAGTHPALNIPGITEQAITGSHQSIKRVQGLPDTRIAAQPHKYLIETNPVLTDLKQFMSSDYLLAGLGYNPDESAKRLGDGLYEQRLIQQAVVARTGQRFLDGQTSDDALYRYLMDNAIRSKQALDLSVGVSLTGAQVAALTHDIVWLEEHEVAGEKVLVPVLYLANADQRLTSNGALIAGHDVSLIAGENLVNAGTLRASNNLSAAAGNDLVNSGRIEAGNRLDLLAGNSIVNQSGGVIAGRDVTLTALTGDVVNERSLTGLGMGEGNRSYYGDSARIEAANDLTIKAARDFTNSGSSLKSGGDTLIDAGRDINIVATKALDSGVSGMGMRTSAVTQSTASVSAGRDVVMNGGRDLNAIASSIDAKRDIVMNAKENMTVASAANEEHAFGKSKKTTIQEDHVSQVGSLVSAGADVRLSAGHDMNLISSRITAGDEAYLVAGEKLSLLAAQDSDYSLYDMKKKSKSKKQTQHDEVTKVVNVGSEVNAGGDIALISGSDQKYQSAKLESGQDLTVQSGGGIEFEGVKDLHQESHSKSKSSLSWNSMSGKGNTDETFKQTQMTAKGDIVIKAVDGLKIDVKHINQETVSQAIDAMVKADPQLAWLEEAEKRGDVDWRRVKETHDSFKYSHSGMGTGAMLVVVIVITVVTAGSGTASAIGTTAGTTATSAASAAGASTVTAAAVGSAASAAASAAYTAVVTQSVVSTINNKGNLGAVLKDVTSSDSIKGYLKSGLAAGFAAGVLDKAFSVSPENAGTATHGFKLGELDGFTKFAGYSLAEKGFGAVTNVAFDGGSLKDQMAQASISAIADVLSASVYNKLGSQLEFTGVPGKVGAHAIVGGLIAEAAGGSFRTGALAAGANEAFVAAVGDSIFSGPMHDQLLAMTSQLIGTTVATVAGGSAKDQQIAGWVAQQATKFNSLDHPTAKRLLKELNDCKANGGCSTEKVRAVIDRYEEISAARSAAIKGCKSRECADGIVANTISMDDPVAQDLLTFFRGKIAYDVPGLLVGNPKDFSSPPQGFDKWGATYVTDNQMVTAKYIQEGWLTPDEAAHLDEWVKGTSWMERAAGRELSVSERARMLTDMGDMLLTNGWGNRAPKPSISKGKVEDKGPGISADADGFGLNGPKEVASPNATGGKKIGPETDLAPEVKLHSDGSYRTPDGKFSSPKGLAPPGTVKADEFAKHLEANGMEVVGTEMVVKGPLGDRRYDIVVRDTNGKLHGLEVKSGTASKTSYQEFTDYFVNQFGAQGKGRLKGEVIESATTVYVP